VRPPSDRRASRVRRRRARLSNRGSTPPLQKTAMRLDQRGELIRDRFKHRPAMKSASPTCGSA
jgi:hypothetical protein